jgi:glycine/D-amino acid oxidase-like deaminating enzyme/nitrite reductase/ring-hydroxylating ferredoxin subunit
MDAVNDIPLHPLERNAETDICIVGAGISGLTTAYELARAGKRVIVLDDGQVGGGETCRTTAHIVNALDDRYMDLERFHGHRGAQLAAESHTAAIARIESIVNEEEIACHFERLSGYLFLSNGEKESLLDDELAAVHRAGLKEVRKLPRAPVDSFDTGPCLEFPDQAQFHPLFYLRGLLQAVEEAGGIVHTGTHVSAIRGGSDAVVETSEGQRVRCEAIVVATNAPVNDNVAIYSKQAPYRTYVIGARAPKPMMTVLLWDTGPYSRGRPAPYHYVRMNGEFLITGGEDHRTGEADDAELRFSRLERWTRERFPITHIDYRWSGQVLEPADGLAMIGRKPFDEDNVFIVTADSGNGMTHGTIAGMLLTDLILGRENEWAEIYNPSRFRVAAAKEFLKENIDVVRELIDYLTPGEIKEAENIAPGNGGVIREGARKIALYRDEKGALQAFSAVCPHKGCIVSWNSLEKSFDCPCHGSRFTAEGKVVNGPSIADLKETSSRVSLASHDARHSHQ